MDDFKKINAAEYVEYLKSIGAPFDRFYKFAKVLARQGMEGEEIKTIMANGLEETVNSVKVDAESGQPDWVIKNPGGEEYIITDKNFKKRYEITGEENLEEFSVYSSKRAEITAVQIKENVSFTAPWGSEMNIAAGGYLVVNNPTDIYGIQYEEFLQTYKPVEGEAPTQRPNN